MPLAKAVHDDTPSSIGRRDVQDTGVIYGMTSAAAAVTGSVGTYLAGVILDTTDSWTMVFQVSSEMSVRGEKIPYNKVGLSLFVFFFFVWWCCFRRGFPAGASRKTWAVVDRTTLAQMSQRVQNHPYLRRHPTVC